MDEKETRTVNLEEGQEDVEAIKAVIVARRRKLKRKRVRTKVTVIVLLIFTFTLLFKSCWGDILTLKQQNRQLQEEQKELVKERDALQEELKETGDKEYIKDQARERLKLLDPGEILFIFDDNKEDADE